MLSKKIIAGIVGFVIFLIILIFILVSNRTKKIPGMVTNAYCNDVLAVKTMNKMYDCRVYFKYNIKNKDYNSVLHFQSGKKYNEGDPITVLYKSKHPEIPLSII